MFRSLWCCVKQWWRGSYDPMTAKLSYRRINENTIEVTSAGGTVTFVRVAPQGSQEFIERYRPEKG